MKSVNELAEEYARERSDGLLLRVAYEAIYKDCFNAAIDQLSQGSEVKLDIKSIEENVVEKWSEHWFDPMINEEDTKNYRRRILAVDANMRYSIARMMSEYASQAIASLQAKLLKAEQENERLREAFKKAASFHKDTIIYCNEVLIESGEIPEDEAEDPNYLFELYEQALKGESK